MTQGEGRGTEGKRGRGKVVEREATKPVDQWEAD